MSVPWQRVKDLVADALELAPDQRAEFLRTHCDGDAALREEVRAMLAAADGAGSFLDDPLPAPHPLPASVRHLTPGRPLGAYVVEELIGEGGFSEVYRARQEEPIQRTVALKLLKPGMDSRAVLTRFAAERHTLARMSHANIARVLDAGATPEGRPFVVMELVRGRPLPRYADAAGLGLRARLALFLQVCDGVEHAHRRGVIHRDLKPSNVLVEEHDGHACAKVIDFGIAKLLDTPDGIGPATEVGAVVGTPAYASPEQLQSSEAGVDTRTDVYGLGALLYELLTGARPGDPLGVAPPSHRLGHRLGHPLGHRLGHRLGDRLGHRLGSQRDSQPDLQPSASLRASPRTSHGAPRPGDLVPPSLRPPRPAVTVDRELDWIAAKALAAERERRYAGVGALAADVRRYLAREPLEAGPPTLGYRMRKFAQRHGVLIAAGATAAGALLVGGIVAALGFVRAQNERAHAVAAADTAEAVSTFLADMLCSASPGRAGRDVRVVDLLATADRMFDGVARAPAAATRLRQVVGETYAALGEYAQAETHLQSGLTLCDTDKTLDPWQRVELLFALTSLRYRQGRIDDGEALAAEVGRLAVAARGDDHPLARHLCDLRAKSAFEHGRPAEAIAALRALLALDEAHGRTDAVIATAGNLAQVLLGTDARDEAAALAQRALALARATHGDTHPLTITTARKLAAVHIRDGDYEALRAAVEPLLPIAERTLGADHPDTLGIENYLACAYQHVGRTAEAERIYRQLLAAQEERVGLDHPQALMAKNNLGILLRETGRAQDAEPLLRDVVLRYRRLRGAEHRDTLAAELQLAMAVADQGRYAEVADDFQRITSAMDRALGDRSEGAQQARQAWAAYRAAAARR